MISLPCSHCQKVLEIDEAFAGGVCRCQFCGTIQTVPSHLKKGAKTKEGPPGRSLYKHPRMEMSGSGLAHLSDPGLSSGLSHQELAAKRAAAPVEDNPRPSKMPIYIAVGAIGLLVLVLLWLLLFTR